jgi:hypothetical protein
MQIKKSERLSSNKPNRLLTNGTKRIAAKKQLEIRITGKAKLFLYHAVLNRVSVNDRLANVRKMLLKTSVVNTTVLTYGNAAPFPIYVW